MRRGRDEIGAAVAAGEAFADDLSGETKVGETAGAAEMRGVAVQICPWTYGSGFLVWIRGCSGAGVGRVIGGFPAPEGKGRDEVGREDRGRGGEVSDWHREGYGARVWWIVDSR